MAPTDKTSFQEWVGGIIARECPHEGLSLDVGCGECRYRQAFKNRLVGYDLDRSVAPDVRGGMTRLPFRDRCFAFATSFQCLYYCRDGREAVDELVRVLVPRGCAIVSLSGTYHLYREHLTAERLPRPRSWRRWQGMFERAGCTVSEIDMPARYSGWRRGLEWLRPQALNPYRFLRVQTPANPCGSKASRD